jgi:hypothetical protein
VTFYDSSTYLGKANVSAGVATLSNVSLTTAGKHYLIASYGGYFAGTGAAQFTPSLSSSAQVTIGGAQTITFWNSSTTYGTPVTLSATASSGLAVTFSVVSGPGSISGSTLTPTGVGAIVVAANQAGNANYLAATAVDKTVTVYQTSLVVTASSPTVIYGAAVPTITASYSGFVNSDSSASLTTQPRCGTAYTTASHAASNPITYCSDAVDSKYSITYTQGAVNVSKATPTVSLWPTATGITYGQALSISSPWATSGTASVGGSFGWTNSSTQPGAGSPTESVTFTPTDATDYNNVTNSVSIAVAKATPTISVVPTASEISYGAALSASKLSGGTIVNPYSSANVAGSFAWTGSDVAPTTTGTISEGVTFTATDSTDYNTATGNVNVTVSKASASALITAWPTASSIDYGQTLANSTLSGGNQGSLSGSFAWVSPTAVPAVGTDSESVIFTPTGASAALYTNATHTVSVVVTRETATVSNWPTPSSITYGQALSNSILAGGSASVAGRYTWNSPTSVPDVGGPAQNVTFTPTNSNYSPVAGTVSVTVIPATPTVSASNWPAASAIAFGSTLANSTLSGGTGSVAGNFAWTDNTVEPVAGTTSNSVTFTPGTVNGYADYSNVIGWVNVVDNPCGLQDTVNSAFSTALSVYNISENPTPALPSPVVMDVEGINQSAICAINASASDTSVSPTTVTYPFITSGAVSSYPADSNSNGTNAAVLAYGTVATAGTGATISIADDGEGDPGSISTSNNSSSGVFASMGGIVNINDTDISTSGNFARGLDATYQGTLNISNVQASTTGNNSAAIAAGIGGGIVAVDGGFYSTNGTRSAGIRAAGTGSGSGPFSTVTVTDADASTSIVAQNADAAVIEGANAVSITSTGGGISLSGALGDNHGVFIYQGIFGDATAGTGIFNMNGGSISYTCDETSGNGNGCTAGTPSNDQNVLPTLFSVSNTTATITLTDVTVTNDTLTDLNINGTLLTVAALSHSGGTATFNASGEVLAGDVIVDATSTATLNMTADTSSDPSTLAGAINAANSGGTVNLTLDATSSWQAADGPSYLTALTGLGATNATCQHASACQVYVGGVLQTSIQ